MLDLNAIRIVLVNPTHPGNIGATARAMKNMGLQRLYLVKPKLFPDAEATARAAHATDILEQAVVTETFEQAIQDCRLVLGTSARTRALPWPTLTAHEAAKQAISETNSGEIAVVFGREKSGLTNEELQRCHYQVEIPSNPDYNSLNIAAAVQIICYELRLASLNHQPTMTENKEEFASIDDLERFYVHLEQVLLDIEFLKPGMPNQVTNRLKRLFNRTRLEITELNILRGILSEIQKKI